MKQTYLFLFFTFLVTYVSGQDLPELIYYKFDTGSTIVNDASTPVGTNPATISGTGLSVGGQGLHDTALQGSGTSTSSGVINTGWNINLSGSFTIGFWTSNIPPSSTLYYIFGDVGADSFRCFTNGVAGSNNWMVRGGGLPDLTITGAATTAPNYIHVVYDAPAGTYTAYVDGVLNATVSAPTSNTMAGTGFQVGGYSTNSNLNGLLDEFRIYSRALDINEIQATINGTIQGGNPNCANPDDLALDNLTATAAEFSWTASPDETNGYNWAVMAAGEHPDNDIPVEDGSTATGILTAAATQLNHNTSYSIFVQTNCGSDLSFWEGPLNITTPITPPNNDECDDAVQLIIGGNFDAYAIVGHNLGATSDSNDPIPTCDAFNFDKHGKDVWYKVEVPATGVINVETRSNNDPGMNNTGMEIYSGTCGNLTLIECDADSGIDDFSLIALTGQTPGETLLVRVWGYNSHVGEFLIAAYGGALPCDNPENLTLVNVGSTYAEFSWTAAATETNGYIWTVMIAGELPDVDTPVESGVVATGVTNATATNLSPESNYDFYVQTDCDADGKSYWEGPLTFTTATVGVDQLSLEGFKLYPNPVENEFNILNENGNCEIAIFNLAGQKIVTQKIQKGSHTLDVSYLVSGTYLVQVTFESGETSFLRVIKK